MEQGFSAGDMGVMFCCSKRTILRRTRKFGIIRRNYSLMSDDELDFIVSEVVSLFPSIGQKTISGKPFLLVKFGPPWQISVSLRCASPHTKLSE